ncbi:MAG: hypothetical protein MR386_07865 [Prevotella sp.]|nr:hypothetical protein [Prevotella sp.]
MKKIVKGNDFTLKIPVMKMVDGQAQAFPLPACTDIVVQVCNQFRRIPLAFEIDVKQDNVLLARVEGDNMSLGTYSIEVKGKIFGNDWRSNEYPQFAIVSKNADADTEFGTTDEGDNSVEMDTAMVILPPTVELSDLINKANDALKTNKETNDTLNANEEARKEAEAQRVTAESGRENAEQTRASAEETRVSAEGDRANAERDRELAEFNRIEAERVRVENENTILANERTRNDNEHERVNAEIMREHAEEDRVTAENSRSNSEVQRVSAENEREFAENGRASAEAERVQAEKKRQNDTSAAIGSMTERINTAIDEFNAHRTEFDEAETARVDDENSRVEAETARANAEKSRVTSENERVSAETDRAEAESNRQTESAKAVKAANDAAAQANATNESIKTNEQGRVDAETNRNSAEKSRNDKEAIRQESENERISQETERQTNEQKRVESENKRIKAEEQRNEILAQAKSDCETAAQAASSAADDATAAKNKAESAATGAERVNIIMQGSTISVTNRDGEVKSVDVINTDEEVTVTITSSVSSINVSGIKINVFLNNGKTPQSYTTNAEGKATFTIDRGNYYQVVFPEYGNAQPIAPVGYTAVLGSRNINVEYLPYDEDSMEKVIITATKYVENVGTAWEGIPVIVTVDRKDTTYQTDAKGQVTVFVPYKKEYTVRIDNQDGYNVSFNKNSRTYTANVPQRLIDYRFYQFKSGIFVVDIDKNEYYIEDWVAAGRNADDAVAIKVADASLSINHGTFCIRTSDIKNVSKLVSRQLCTQDLQFNSIALNGNNVNDANYYNGESSTYLIRQEAQERSLSVPAFDYAYGQIFNLGGEDLHGFVMSVGQEYVHVANIGIIRQVLETLYGEEVATNYYNFVMKNRRWTSTQGNATSAWFYSSSANYTNKSYSLVVLPVFAC